MSTSEAVPQFKPLGKLLPPVYPPHHYLGLNKRVESARQPGRLGTVESHYQSGHVGVQWDNTPLKAVCAPNEVDPA